MLKRVLGAIAVLLGVSAHGLPARAGSVEIPALQLWPDPPAVEVPGVLSRPEGDGPFPAMVILPNCGGPKKHEFTTFWPGYLNSLGYVTLTVDSFTPRGERKCSRQFRPSKMQMTQDAYGALGYLAGLDFIDASRIGVLGSSLGARVINWFSGFGKTTPGGARFRAGVTLYAPTCKDLRPGDRMVPTLVLLGDREKGVASCRSLPAHENLTVHIFPGVYHAFDQPVAKLRKDGQMRSDVFGNKMLYNAEATRKAQDMVKSFLAEKFSGAAPVYPVTDAPQVIVPAAGKALPRVGRRDPYVAVENKDRNGDGKVGRDEWDRKPEIFPRIDADGDGFVTPLEFYNHWKRRL